jgi:hypothetical protein
MAHCSLEMLIPILILAECFGELKEPTRLPIQPSLSLILATFSEKLTSAAYQRGLRELPMVQLQLQCLRQVAACF